MILQHVQSQPVAPSARSGLPIPTDLDGLILRCLAKDPADRPAGAEDLAAALGRIDVGSRWTDDDARAWWDAHVAKGAPAPAESEPTITLDVATEY